MAIKIRRAEQKDIPFVMKLLCEVHELHAKIRPDIFIEGAAKYTEDELAKIFLDEHTPVFVAEDDGGKVIGHAFCVIKKQPFSTNMKDLTTLYIDDICVDADRRGCHIGSKLYEYVLDYARANGCYDITLNVWEGNDSAKRFYEKMGMFVKETQMEIIL